MAAPRDLRGTLVLYQVGAASRLQRAQRPFPPGGRPVRSKRGATARRRQPTSARVVAVLNGCATRGSDADDTEQALADRGVEVCPVRIGQRVVFQFLRDLASVTRPSEPTGKAAAEIARVPAVLSVHREHSRGTP